MIVDPSRCARKITDLYGTAGIAWLENLPSLVEEFSERWLLEILPPFDVDSYSYVCPAIRNQAASVVLKAGVPDREFLCQIEALKIFNGDGSVRLLDADPPRGVMLLERITPGTMLVDLADDIQITAIAGQLMRRFWKTEPLSHSFPSVTDWANGLIRLHQRFEDGYGPFPRELIDLAEEQFTNLLSGEDQSFLIHGDINPYNILKAEREPWLAIDPKGVIGSPYYDVATFLNNLPLGRPVFEMKRILSRRIAQLCDILDFDPKRMRKWGQAQAILSSFWSFEDHGSGWQLALDIAWLYDLI